MITLAEVGGDAGLPPGLDAGWTPTARLSGALGRLARDTSPLAPPMDGDALGAALAEATRLGPVTVDGPEGAPWAVRDAVAAVRRGFARLGVVTASGDAAEARGPRVLVGPADAMLRLAARCSPDRRSCVVAVGAPPWAELEAELPNLAGLPPVACTEPALVRFLWAAGAQAALWSPLAQGADAAPPPSDPRLAGLPTAARGPAPPLWSERPLHVVSLGREGPVVAAGLGRLAPFLAERPCAIIHRRGMWRLADEPTAPEAVALHLFRRARVVLNLVGGDASLDWSQGALDAMAQGALLVGARAFPWPGLRAGEQYLQEETRHLPSLLRWLLETREGAERARAVRRAGTAAAIASGAPGLAAARLLVLLIGDHRGGRG